MAVLDQIENHLTKTNGWFAGGEEPTSADYMMIFCLEAWATEDKGAFGPKTMEYIKRVHARYEILSPPSCSCARC